METVKVERGATIILDIVLGLNVSGQEFLLEMREDEDPASTVLAYWEITFTTDGTNGELEARIDDSVTTTLMQDTAWLFLYRVDGTLLPVFEAPLEVEIMDLIPV